MKYYLIAGERSGDLHGGNLIKKIKEHDPEANIRGFGGDNMNNAGLDLQVHHRELAFMGITDVITSLPKILRLLSFCKKDILKFKPDAIILIDYAGFNLKIARFAKKHHFKVFYYISPKVWAWKKSRAWTISKFVDKLYAIMPFEPEFYKQFNMDVTYVGNPVADAVREHQVNQDFLHDNQIPHSDKYIALLPGSRKHELQRLLPVMAEIATAFSQYQFLVAAIYELPDKLYQPIADLKNVTLVYEQAYDLLAHSDAAIVTSGTATLETALWKVPQVVVFKTNPLSYAIGSKLVLKNIDYFSLVNLIAQKQVVKELLQDQVNISNIKAEMEALLRPEVNAEILKGYALVEQKIGTSVASDITAKLIIQELRKES